MVLQPRPSRPRRLFTLDPRAIAGLHPANAGRDSAVGARARISARRPSLSIADEHRHRDIQGGGETADVVEADVSTSELDLGHIRAMELGTLGKGFLGQAATRPKRPDRGSEGSKERV